MKLTRYEQETIIRFDEENKSADVYTHNQKLIRRLAELQDKFPCDVILQRTGQETSPESVSYTIPKAWVRINACTKPLLTEEQKEQRRAQLEDIRSRKGQN